MTSVAIDERRRPAGVADGILTGAAGGWFAATLAGQAAFLYYIIAFYGPPTLAGNYHAWDRNPFLRKGYIAGDDIGNLAFAAHVAVAAVVTFGGLIQLLPQIRARAITFHRWNGRLFMLGAIVAGLSGLYIVWMRGEIESLSNAVAISLNGVLILVFAALAWGKVLKGDIAAHRRWAMRLFMVANGVFFLRMMVSAWFVLIQISPGPFFHVLEFASYLLPLAVLELYLRARRGGALGKIALAPVLAGLAALTSIGAFGFIMIFVQRVLSAA
jgi:hypothetical protein